MENRFKKFDQYGLRYFLKHLIALKRWDDLTDILCNLYFVEAKCSADMVYSLIDDYQTTLDTLPEGGENQKQRKTHESRIQKYLEELIAFSEGKIQELNVIPSIKPKNEEAIQEAAEKIKHQPFARFHKVQDFSRFVNTHIFELEQYGDTPGFCVQQAYNWVREGPVGNAVEKIIAGKYVKDRVLLLHESEYRSNFNPAPALIWVFADHSGEVRSVAVTPDGTIAVSGGRDNLVRLWNVKLGQCLQKFEGHQLDVTDVAISANGQIAASSSWDKTIRIWDIQKNQCLHTIGPLPDSPHSLSITADGNRIMAVYEDQTIGIWDAGSGECIATFNHPHRSIRSLRAAISANGEMAVSVDSEHLLKVWDVKNNRLIRSMKGSSSVIRDIALTPDGRVALLASEDTVAFLWDLIKGECIRVLEGHFKEVISVALSADGKIAVTGSWDNTIRAWDTSTGQCLRVLKGHTDYIESVAITADASMVLSASDDCTIRVWDIEKGLDESIEKRLDYYPGAAVRSADGRIEVKKRRDTDTIEVRNMTTKRLLYEICPLIKPITTLAISGDGRIIASSNDLGQIQVWDAQSGNNNFEIKAHDSGLWDVALSFDGCFAVSTGKDKQMKIWDLVEGQCLHTIQHEALHVAIAHDGSFFISGGDDGSLRVWSVRLAKCIKTMTGHFDFIRVVAVSPNSWFAVTGGRDKSIRVWELATGRCIGLCTHKSWPISIVIFDQYLKVGYFDRSVTFIKLANIEICKPFHFDEIEKEYADERELALERERKSLANDITPMKYRIQVYKEDGIMKYYGQSETLESYTFENLGPFLSLDVLLDSLDNGMQRTADSHRKAYRVNTFEIHPKGSIKPPKARMFFPK